MIRKVRGGYKVLSGDGRPLSKILKNHASAVKRLRQVEWFKNRGGK